MAELVLCPGNCLQMPPKPSHQRCWTRRARQHRPLFLGWVGKSGQRYSLIMCAEGGSCHLFRFDTMRIEADVIRAANLLVQMSRRRKKRRPPCNCATCRQDCGVCLNCRDKPRFGGAGVRKQACLLRSCRFTSRAPMYLRVCAPSEDPTHHVPYRKEGPIAP